MKPNDTEHANMPNGEDARADAARQDAAPADFAPQDIPQAANDAVPPSATADLDPIAVLEAEKTDLKDKLLRTLAEMENLRRRTGREMADARAYAITNFARDVLTVADNVRRAVESVPSEARAGAEGPFKALIEGIELTERDLLKTLERHGIRKLDPEGEKFDPNLHQAMFEVPKDDVPSGTVVQVVQPGFAIAERVLRPALVGVAKGGPKAPNEGAAPAEPTESA
jgi:molecular chaperone GrpE